MVKDLEQEVQGPQLGKEGGRKGSASKATGQGDASSL